MKHVITQPIKGYSVVEGGAAVAASPGGASQGTSGETGRSVPEKSTPEKMHEGVGRPELLHGATYKIKSAGAEHALYVTINDITLNAGSEHERRHPFEIFVNSKNMEQFQWVVALTRIMSAVFRKGGDTTFLVEEMRAVFDPRGGYFKPGGVFVPSLVAEIGMVLEKHLKAIGLMPGSRLDESQQQAIDAKRAEWERRQAAAASAATTGDRSADGGAEPDMKKSGMKESGMKSVALPGAAMCAKCHEQAVVVMDGCATCLSCGASKCG